MINQFFRKKSVEQILAEVKATEEGQNEHGLAKHLGLRDLVSFGVAAIIGAGIFATIGKAAYEGGPAIVYLFLFTAVGCVFSALCYAQFASTVPISGSAYTYAYTAFGELIAWVLGWALVMEYAIGNIAVAISWSEYFTQLLSGFGLNIPTHLSMDYLSASRGYEQAVTDLASGKTLTVSQQAAYEAWQNAFQIGGFRLIADLPALLITIAITTLVYVGVKESRNAGNIMVFIKMAVVIMVIVVGAFYVTPANWSPFAPNGIDGILKSVSAVFFAYIGFDAISTTAEECKNPQRDMPRAMIYSLLICTVLYVLIALVLTGMVHYSKMDVADPLAMVFDEVGLSFLAGVISVSAVVAITSVFLVFQLGQPRILMSMSRDGLLPSAFAKVHTKYKTPYISTIATGFLVAIPALFMNMTEVTDLTSIGTLFAFAMVSAGILRMPVPQAMRDGKKQFRVPYYNSRYFIPIIYFAFAALLAFQYTDALQYFVSLDYTEEESSKMALRWLFLALALYMGVMSVWRSWSLIPVLGVLVNVYLMTELNISNWYGFGFWMIAGLVIYAGYGYKNSKLRQQEAL
ncbi:MAG: amino acid permease [Cytophagales bacterium]|nr:MAG: amino acid permease [Cytophagales bacterium]TAF62278.1 MAG: amino acid permease [Cytophagales bacterium]